MVLLWCVLPMAISFKIYEGPLQDLNENGHEKKGGTTYNKMWIFL